MVNVRETNAIPTPPAAIRRAALPFHGSQRCNQTLRENVIASLDHIFRATIVPPLIGRLAHQLGEYGGARRCNTPPILEQLIPCAIRELLHCSLEQHGTLIGERVLAIPLRK
jgi:hypothetical protein